ncbi:MAG: lysophospholipid acyltransferase family protein [Candidatus Fimenecus sp.]
MRNLKKTIKSYRFLLRFYLYIFVILIPKIPYFNYLTKEGRIGERTEKAFKTVQKWADYTVKIGKSKVTVNGLEKIPTDRPVLFVSNHESYADIPMLIYALRDFNFGFMLKSTMENIPFIKNYLKYMYCVTVDQSDIRRGAAAINEAADFINSGKSLLIFPEGRRSFSNTPDEFKNGAFKVAQKTGVTVVPIYIHNIHLTYEGNGRRVAPADISVNVLDPIETDKMSRAEVKELNEKVFNLILEYSRNFPD